MDYDFFYYSLTTPKRDIKEHRFWFLLISLVFIIVYLLANFLCGIIFKTDANYINANTVSVSITGHSMEPTMTEGDIIKATSVFNVEHGMIAVIDMLDGTNYVKTVVALEGDRVERNGSIIRVYKKQKRPTAFSGILEMLNFKTREYCTIITDFNSSFEYSSNITRVLGRGEMFVMGDNYNHSTDSTEKMIGILKTDQILYKVIGLKSIFYDRLN